MKNDDKKNNIIDEESQRKNESNSEIYKINKKDDVTIIKVEEDPARWFIFVSFCLCLFANGFQFLTFTSFSEDFSDFYEIKQWKINMLSLIYLIIYPILFIPEFYIIKFYDLKFGLMLAAGATMLGSFFKLFINADKTKTVIYLGQTLSGLFRPLLLILQFKIPNIWFKENKRTLMCSICCLSDILGILVGYLCNLAYIHEDEDMKNYREQTFKNFLSQFILVIFCCGTIFFIEKNRPSVPPSISQANIDLKNKGIFKNLKTLFKNINFIFLMISIFFILGYFYTNGIVFNHLLNIYSLTRKKAAVIYTISNVVAIIASVIISIFVDKYQKYRIFFIILNLSGIFFQIFLTFLLEIVKNSENKIYPIYIVFHTLTNASIISFYCIAINFTCEIIFPIDESFGGGLLLGMGHLFGIAGFFLNDHFIKDKMDKPWISNVVFLIGFGISGIFTFFYEDNLIRYYIDSNPNLKEEEDKKDEYKKVMLLNIQVKN